MNPAHAGMLFHLDSVSELPLAYIAAIAVGGNLSSPAAKFSVRGATPVVPGMGIIFGARCTSQATATCDVVTPRFSAQLRSTGDASVRPTPIGNQGKKAILSSAGRST